MIIDLRLCYLVVIRDSSIKVDIYTLFTLIKFSKTAAIAITLATLRLALALTLLFTSVFYNFKYLIKFWKTAIHGFD